MSNRRSLIVCDYMPHSLKCKTLNPNSYHYIRNTHIKPKKKLLINTGLPYKNIANEEHSENFASKEFKLDSYYTAFSKQYRSKCESDTKLIECFGSCYFPEYSRSKVRILINLIYTKQFRQGKKSNIILNNSRNGGLKQ